MATFFSLHIIEAEDKSASYFVTAMIVSPFLQTVFLLIIYTFGGQVIQKTLYVSIHHIKSYTFNTKPIQYISP